MYPSFQQPGVPTVTLRRGQSWPVQSSIDTGQVIGLTDGFQAVSVKFATRVTRHTLQLTGVSQSDFDALWAFLWHPLVDGSQQPFTWVDERGVSRRVRWILEQAFTWTETASGRLDVTLTLREDA